MRILGIDPGTLVTGYGLIESDGTRNVYVASGCIRAQGEGMPQRLKMIYDQLSEIVATYRPQEIAVEQVFVHRNVDSALKLGQARGAAICAGMSLCPSVSEYTPRQIKQAVVGTGAAAKPQIQHMVRILLGLSSVPPPDAADALAVALCHSHTRHTLGRMSRLRGGSAR
ncbi:MAG: crossover junction endodeoxyribonuclease RuvC [Gammaproteobacteria bacterium]|nr:crossover junction endodeoxyribonuclease RuvC [Gammaproteobacteria bacterium]